MQLEALDNYKKNYTELITTNPNYDELYKWESLQKFQNNWDIEAQDFGAMYDQSLNSKVSANLWASQFFYPKQMMLEFIKIDQEKVRTMFKELFNEDLLIEKRINRFVQGCHDLLLIHQKDNPEAKNHYHDGYRIISVYLCFRYPTKYAIYKYSEFKTFMEALKVTNIPGTKEIARFFKVMNTIYNFLAKDAEFMAIHNKVKEDPKHYQEETLLLAQDFYWCCSRYGL